MARFGAILGAIFAESRRRGAEGGGVSGGVSLSSVCVGFGKEAVPPPRKIWNFSA